MSRVIILVSGTWTPGGVLIETTATVPVTDDFLRSLTPKDRRRVISQIRAVRDDYLRQDGFDPLVLDFQESWRIGFTGKDGAAFRGVVPLDWAETGKE